MRAHGCVWVWMFWGEGSSAVSESRKTKELKQLITKTSDDLELTWSIHQGNCNYILILCLSWQKTTFSMGFHIHVLKMPCIQKFVYFYPNYMTGSVKDIKKKLLAAQNY